MPRRTKSDKEHQRCGSVSRIAMGALLVVTIAAFGWWCFIAPAAHQFPGTISSRPGGVPEGFCNLGYTPSVGPHRATLDLNGVFFHTAKHKVPLPQNGGKHFHAGYHVDRLLGGEVIVVIDDRALLISDDGTTHEVSFTLPPGKTSSRRSALDTLVDERRVHFLITDHSAAGQGSFVATYDIPATFDSASPVDLAPNEQTPTGNAMRSGYFLGSKSNWIATEPGAENVTPTSLDSATVITSRQESLKLPDSYAAVHRVGNGPVFASAKTANGFELARLHTDESLKLDDRTLHISVEPYMIAPVAVSPNQQWLLVKAFDMNVQNVLGVPRRCSTERLVLIDVPNWSIAAETEWSYRSFRMPFGNLFRSARFSPSSTEMEVATFHDEIITVDIQRWIASTAGQGDG